MRLGLAAGLARCFARPDEGSALHSAGLDVDSGRSAGLDVDSAHLAHRDSVAHLPTRKLAACSRCKDRNSVD